MSFLFKNGIKKLYKTALIILPLSSAYGQGTFSGDLMTNLNFFREDTNIKASGNHLYDNALSGGEAWLTLRYNISGYTFFARGDVFNNSNLKNPTTTMSDFGLAAWNVSKETNKMFISLGTIYDQIGSGIIFRSYEDRGLLIDNALVGLQLKYKITNNIVIKGMTGQQRNNNFVNNVRYQPIIKAVNLEGDFDVNKVHITPGLGVLDRTIDIASMDVIAAAVNNQEMSSRFIPKYNMYAMTVYNTLMYKNITWYCEAAYKTNEAIIDTRAYSNMYNKLINKDGNIQYTTLSYAKKGWGITLSGKRTENFVMRTSPNELLLNGMMNWQPVVAVLRPHRLMSRYTPPSQDISEMAGSANLNIVPSDATSFTFTYTHINTLDNRKLFREAFFEGIYQGAEAWILEGGVQYLEYNTELYQIRPAPVQFAITPFTEVTYRINDKKSLRGELQYMHAANDYGSWFFALLEFNIAPKWSFSVSDMYNTVPNKGSDNPNYKDPGNHYYNFFAAYTIDSHRFTLAYVKQVDGINCTGGVCRYEPAFSGLKMSITSSF